MHYSLPVTSNCRSKGTEKVLRESAESKATEATYRYFNIQRIMCFKRNALLIKNMEAIEMAKTATSYARTTLEVPSLYLFKKHR